MRILLLATTNRAECKTEKELNIVPVHSIETQILL